MTDAATLLTRIERCERGLVQLYKAIDELTKRIDALNHDLDVHMAVEDEQDEDDWWKDSQS